MPRLRLLLLTGCCCKLFHDYIRLRLDQLENFAAFSSRHDSVWPYFMIAARNATQRNPRSVGQDATGWLTFKMRVPEPLSKEFVYEAAPSSCFVVGKEQGPVLKPIWGDDSWWTPSRYTIVCQTLVAVDRIVPSFSWTTCAWKMRTSSTRQPSSPCQGDNIFSLRRRDDARGCARTHICPAARESAAGHSPFSYRTMRHHCWRN